MILIIFNIASFLNSFPYLQSFVWGLHYQNFLLYQRTIIQKITFGIKKD